MGEERVKKILKILLILAAALLLHLLAGSAGLFRAVGTQGQAAVRVCIWSGAGFFWVSILRDGG